MTSARRPHNVLKSMAGRRHAHAIGGGVARKAIENLDKAKASRHRIIIALE